MPITTITGSTFDFTGEYFSPSWSGIHFYQFGEGFINVNQVWADTDYVYAACQEGLNIIDIPSEMQYAFVTYSGGFNSVWANEEKVFLATSNSGIKYLDKSCISGSTYMPFGLNCLQDYASVPRLRSNEVRYIHGFGNLIVCCTASGVQSLGIYGYESETLVSGAMKCFLAPTSTAIYYTLSGTTWSVNKVNTAQNDWISPHKSYLADGSCAIPSGVYINDIFVTEGTSLAGPKYNTLFVATSDGVVVIDEGTNNGVIYRIEEEI